MNYWSLFIVTSFSALGDRKGIWPMKNLALAISEGSSLKDLPDLA